MSATHYHIQVSPIWAVAGPVVNTAGVRLERCWCTWVYFKREKHLDSCGQHRTEGSYIEGNWRIAVWLLVDSGK